MNDTTLSKYAEAVRSITEPTPDLHKVYCYSCGKRLQPKTSWLCDDCLRQIERWP